MAADLTSFLSHVAIALAAVGAVAVASALAILHQMRKRWRALRAHAGVRAGVALFASVWRGRRGRAAGGWRFELWEAVLLATRAVRSAEQSLGGALGDLRSLNRRLRSAAEQLDGMAAVASDMPTSTPELDAVRVQVDDLLAASTAIRRAALASAANASSARTRQLAADAGAEVESVLAGVVRARTALSGN